MTTVVRPSEADFGAIARRISGPLSPDGAEAWYRNDAAMLLQEIVTLRQELAELRQEVDATRQSFYQDGAQVDYDAPLYEWAEAWKASSTGFWQKAQTKTLREQLATQRIATANLRDALAAAEDANRRLVVDKSAVDAELVEARQAIDTLEQKHDVDRDKFLRRIAELDELLAQARQESVQMRADMARDMQALNARNEEQLARARELMDRAMEAL